MDAELKWILVLIVLAFDGMFLAAVVAKYRSVRQASLWVAAPGKVVSSRPEARRVTRMSNEPHRTKVHDTEIRNYAAIRYVFEADGRQQQGQRISLAADLGNFQVAERLKRYPVGTEVTVYYDRHRPDQSVLERDILPMHTFETIILAGILIALFCLFLLLSDDVMAGLSALRPDTARGTAALVAGVLAALGVAFGCGLQLRGGETKAWPSTDGLVLASDLEVIKVGRPFALRLLNKRALLRDRTIYSYRVDGVTYRSDRTSLGVQTYATFSYFARRAADRFEPGSKVAVYYNPKLPTEAVLIRGAPGGWLVWLVAAGLAGLAAHLAGLL